MIGTHEYQLSAVISSRPLAKVIPIASNLDCTDSPASSNASRIVSVGFDIFLPEFCRLSAFRSRAPRRLVGWPIRDSGTSLAGLTRHLLLLLRSLAIAMQFLESLIAPICSTLDLRFHRHFCDIDHDHGKRRAAVTQLLLARHMERLALDADVRIHLLTALLT